MNLLIKHARIHGINITIELLRISNIATRELSVKYELNRKIKRLESLTPQQKQKLWDKSKGADDRLAFCKAVITLIYEYENQNHPNQTKPVQPQGNQRRQIQKTCPIFKRFAGNGGSQTDSCKCRHDCPRRKHAPKSNERGRMEGSASSDR